MQLSLPDASCSNNSDSTPYPSDQSESESAVSFSVSGQSISASRSPLPSQSATSSTKSRKRRLSASAKKTVLILLKKGQQTKSARSLLKLAKRRSLSKRSKVPPISVLEVSHSAPIPIDAMALRRGSSQNGSSQNVNGSHDQALRRGSSQNVNGVYYPHSLMAAPSHKGTSNSAMHHAMVKPFIDDMMNDHLYKPQPSGDEANSPLAASGKSPNALSHSAKSRPYPVDHIGLSPDFQSTRAHSPSWSSHSGPVMGRCQNCNTEAPLIEYITALNKHSKLTALRDKLSAVEAVASILRREIQQIQSTSNAESMSMNRVHNADHADFDKKQVSNPFMSDSSGSFSYKLSNLTHQQQQILSSLTTRRKITFPLKGTSTVSPQENVGFDVKFKEMRRRYERQDFFVGLDSERCTLTVHTKISTDGKQYRQVRSFASLSGAEFESAQDNVLKIWFSNTRGYFLQSFASETEANTVLNLINIIVHNESLHNPVPSQLEWASYVDKKGRRMGMFSAKFLCLIGLELKLYKTHNNYLNGETPAQRLNLMECDLARKGKEIKFSARNSEHPPKQETVLTIKLNSECERDDFLNLCAQTLGTAIRGKNVQFVHSVMTKPASPSHTAPYSQSVPTGNVLESHQSLDLPPDRDESGTDAEDSELWNENEEKSEYNRFGSQGVDDDEDEEHSMVLKSMTWTLRGPSTKPGASSKNKEAMHGQYIEQLANTPRMYGAGLHKALDRLAKKRPSDIDFIETTFKGNEIVLRRDHKSEDIKTYQLLDVLGKSMISGAFLNSRLYLHKQVWEQNKVMVVNYEKKLETFGVMLAALNVLFRDISIDWLKSDFDGNARPFHEKLVKCEKQLREAQSILTDFIQNSKQKAQGKGAAKFLNKFKDKVSVKVFDNQPYRDLIYQICGHASSMQLYYLFLAKPRANNEENRKMLLHDVKGITLCMASFGRVVVHDTKEFLFAYLRRGAKNLYQ